MNAICGKKHPKVVISHHQIPKQFEKLKADKCPNKKCKIKKPKVPIDKTVQQHNNKNTAKPYIDLSKDVSLWQTLLKLDTIILQTC